MKIVPAGGGIPRPAAINDTSAGELSYAWPWFLPDGEHFIFTATMRMDDENSSVKSRLKLGSIDTTSSRTLYEMGNVDRVEYAYEGYILYVENDNLMGLPFDAEKLEVTGEPRPIAMKIGAATNTYAFGVSNNGTLLYQTNNQSSLSELVWVDRTGDQIETVGQRGMFSDIEISPDENRIAYALLDRDVGTSEIWVYDLRRNVPTRLTFDLSSDFKPLWSPDGQYVYFTTRRDAQNLNIFRKRANGLGEAEPVLRTETSSVVPGSFTPDGNRLLFYERRSNWDIGVLDSNESDSIAMLANSSFDEFMPRVSPNGKYVAYVSGESGNSEIYVRKMDGSGGKWQISTEHARNPMWRGDGKELFYLTMDDRVMAVDVKTQGDFEAGNSAELFATRIHRLFPRTKPIDVTAGGQKFLLNVEISDAEPGEIVVVQNWAEEFVDK
jgi:Tol biopolymer transport system component